MCPSVFCPPRRQQLGGRGLPHPGDNAPDKWPSRMLATAAFWLNMMSPIQGESAIVPGGLTDLPPGKFAHEKFRFFCPLQDCRTWRVCKSAFEIWLWWRGDVGGGWDKPGWPRPASITPSPPPSPPNLPPPAHIHPDAIKLDGGNWRSHARHKLMSLER